MSDELYINIMAISLILIIILFIYFIITSTVWSDIWHHTYFLFPGDEERMTEDWISICGFLEDITSKKGKGPTLFEDVIGIQEKSGRRGPILFEDLGLEIQDKNSSKRTYLVDIRIVGISKFNPLEVLSVLFGLFLPTCLIT